MALTWQQLQSRAAAYQEAHDHLLSGWSADKDELAQGRIVARELLLKAESFTLRALERRAAKQSGQGAGR